MPVSALLRRSGIENGNFIGCPVDRFDSDDVVPLVSRLSESDRNARLDSVRFSVRVDVVEHFFQIGNVSDRRRNDGIEKGLPFFRSSGRFRLGENALVGGILDDDLSSQAFFVEEFAVFEAVGQAVEFFV